MNRRPGAGWIIVGLDGDDSDRAVLDVALRQAAQSGSALCVVRTLGLSDPPPDEAYGTKSPDKAYGTESPHEAYGTESPHEAYGTDRPRPAATVPNRVAAILKQVRREVEQAASTVAPTVVIEYEVVPGDPATALLTAGREADLIVLGTRCDGATPALMLGQVSQDVAVHSRCPVLLVPPPTGGCGAGPDSAALTA